MDLPHPHTVRTHPASQESCFPFKVDAEEIKVWELIRKNLGTEMEEVINQEIFRPHQPRDWIIIESSILLQGVQFLSHPFLWGERRQPQAQAYSHTRIPLLILAFCPSNPRTRPPPSRFWFPKRITSNIFLLSFKVPHSKSISIQNLKYFQITFSLTRITPTLSSLDLVIRVGKIHQGTENPGMRNQ